MRKLLPLLMMLTAALGLAQSAQAQTPAYMVVWDKAGATVSIPLGDITNISLTSTQLSVDRTGTPYALPTDNFRKFTFAANATGVSNVKESTENFEIYPNPTSERLYVRGTTARQAYVYAIDGRLCLTATVTDNGIDVRQLSTGLYMIRIGNIVTKFRKL